MKHWGLFLLAFSFAACQDDRPGDVPTEQTYYITPEHESVEAGSTGLQARIAVSSNCNWQVGKVPEWCIVQKTSAGEREYLDITVQYNDDETPRNTGNSASLRPRPRIGIPFCFPGGKRACASAPLGPLFR